jgi:hypothetical protein
MLAVRRLLAGGDTFQQNPSLPRDSNQRTVDFHQRSARAGLVAIQH